MATDWRPKVISTIQIQVINNSSICNGKTAWGHPI